MAVSSCQPSTDTFPSRASTATTMRRGNLAQAASTTAGVLMAAVPVTANLAPRSNSRAQSSTERTPPPTSTSSVLASMIFRIVEWLFSVPPENAASRSTT